MPYTPPAHNAVNPNFITSGYTPPAHNAVDPIFGIAVFPTGVFATAAARGVTPGVGGQVTQAFATGVARAVTVMYPGHAPVTGVHATGVARAPTPQISVTLQRVTATALARPVAGGVSVTAPRVTATGRALAIAGINTSVVAPRAFAIGRALKPGFGKTQNITGVHATARVNAVTVTVNPNDVFPVYSLMRNTPVATAGAMSNQTLAFNVRLLPSGPTPQNVEVHLTQVVAVARAVAVWPSRNVRVTLTGVRAVARAKPVATTT